MITDDIKKIMKEGKAIIGTEKTVKALKQGKTSEVFISSNCPADVKETIESYSRIGGVKVSQLEIPNDELGVICRKSFAISVMCVIKEK